MKRKHFEVSIWFKDIVLGAKPLDPAIYISHKIESTRQSINKWAKSESKNQEALTFLDASQIDNEDVQEGLRFLREGIEEYHGDKISDQSWEAALANNLKKDDPLFQTIKESKGKTIFARCPETRVPILEAYVLKGAIKDLATIACERNKNRFGFLSSKQATTSLINRHLFVLPTGGGPEVIPFYKDKDFKEKLDVERDSGGKIEFYTRPLRANTPQGPVVAISASEHIRPPAGMRFIIRTYLEDEMDEKALRKILEVGEDYGFSQWRNSGKGRFTFEMKKVNWKSGE